MSFSISNVPTLLSLQDICKLKVLFNLESFPDHLLSQLPRSIRIGLLKALPIIDRLHYENSLFLRGIEVKNMFSPQENDETEYFSQSRLLHGDNDTIKEKLFKCLFLSMYAVTMMPTLMEGCILNLKEMFNFTNSLFTSSEDSLTRIFTYIQNFLPCKILTFTYIPYYENQPPPFNWEKLSKKYYLIFPTRFMEFLHADEPGVYADQSDIGIAIANVQKFRSYCNLHTIAPNSLFIDATELVNSPIYSEYDTIMDSVFEKHKSSSSTGVPVVDQISPSLQSILASVEHLSIEWIKIFEPYDGEEDLSIDTPHFILANSLAHEKPHLKSIHINGVPRYVIYALVTVGAFLCGVEDYPVADRINNRYTVDGDEYSLALPSKQYCIEEFSFTAKSGLKDFAVQYMIEFHSTLACKTVKTIVMHQKATLKHLALDGLGFTFEDFESSFEYLEYSSINRCDLEIVNCDEYRSLLNTTLVDFVQLPQFESLELGDSPDTECYPLILAFMTTPTSHEQKLVISLWPDSKPTISDWCEQYPIPTALPHSNVQFKSLVLKGEESQAIKHLFKYSNLSLKFLHLSTSFLTGIFPDRVSITSFSLMVEDNKVDVADFDAKLDVFICQNTSLRTLELNLEDTSFETYSVFFSKLNRCLLQLLKENRLSLQLISIKEMDLSDYVSDDGIEIPPSHQTFNFSAWFHSLPLQSDSSEVPLTLVHKPHIFMFFCLAQKLNASLKISSSSYVFKPENLRLNLIPLLEKAFGKPEIKIRSVTLNSKLGNCKEVFEQIAFSVNIVD